MFSIVITSLGKERAGLPVYAIRAFVYLIHVCVTVFFFFFLSFFFGHGLASVFDCDTP